MNNRHGTAGDTPTVRKRSFLLDVLICSLGAYGGPESHIAVFLNQMVHRRGYLTEQELLELLALNSLLPGPTSTQTLIAIGYRTGGRVLALLTFLVWAAPVVLFMTAAAFAYDMLDQAGLSGGMLRFLSPMAVGFIIYASIRIGGKVVSGPLTGMLWVAGAVISYLFHLPWVFPLLLLSGGFITAFVNRTPDAWKGVPLHPPWWMLATFLALAVGGALAAGLTESLPVQIFESFYRYGYLVFGGGQVVVPLMQTELVEIRNYMTNGEFLTGYGLVQGVPGPMFGFGAFAGGMAARGLGTTTQIGASLIGGTAIFLPGILLIFFVFPVWDSIRKIAGIRQAIAGVNAVAGGLIGAAVMTLAPAVILSGGGGASVLINLAVMALTAGVLWFKLVPAPLMVILATGAGLLFG